MSENEPEAEGTFQDSRPALQSHVDPSGKTTSISCECGACAMAVVDTVVGVLVAVGVAVLPHAARTSANALSAKAAATGVKRCAVTLATLGEHRLGEVVTLFRGRRNDEDGRADVTDVLVEKVVRAEPILDADEVPRVVLIRDEQ